MIARVFQTQRSHQRHSSYTENMRGGSVSVFSGDGAHEFTVQGGLQEISDAARMASQSVRQQKGHRLKTSAKYTWRQEFLVEGDKDEEGNESMAHVSMQASSGGGGLSPMGNTVGFAKQQLAASIRMPTGEASDITLSAQVRGH